MSTVLNPHSGRSILVGKGTYNNLISEGYVHDRQLDVLMHSNITSGGVSAAGGPTGGSNINHLDTDIGVEPLKPTAYQTFKSKIVRNAGKVADWLWNRLKNVSYISQLILSQKDKIVNKLVSPTVFPTNIVYNEPVPNIIKSKKAFQNDTSEYEITILNKEDPLIQMKQLNEAINALLSKELKKMLGLKFNIGMEIIFQKDEADGNVIQNSFTFVGNAETMTHESNMCNAIQSQNQNINNRIDQFTNEGSGWTVHEITRHFMRVNKYKPLAARSYIKLPEEITNRKATINIQNKDDKCFMYCLGRALDPNPEKHHLERVNKHLIDACLKLGFDKIEMPVAIKDIPSIEKKFRISINIFEHHFHDNTEQIYPILLTKLTNANHENLLDKSKATNNKYVLIKDFNRLCSNVECN